MRTLLITLLAIFTISSANASGNFWGFERHVGDNAEVNESTLNEYRRNLEEQARAATERLNNLRDYAVRRSLQGDNSGWYDYAREYARISNLPYGNLR